MIVLEPEGNAGSLPVLFQELDTQISAQIPVTENLLHLNTLKEVEVEWLSSNDVERHTMLWTMVLSKIEEALSPLLKENCLDEASPEVNSFVITLFTKFFSKCNLLDVYNCGIDQIQHKFNANHLCFCKLGLNYAPDLVSDINYNLSMNFLTNDKINFLDNLIINAVNCLHSVGKYNDIAILYKNYKLLSFFESLNCSSDLKTESIFLFYMNVANSLINSQNYTDSIDVYKIIVNIPFDKMDKKTGQQFIYSYNINLLLLPTDHVYYLNNPLYRFQEKIDFTLVNFSSLYSQTYIYQLVQAYYSYDYNSVEQILNSEFASPTREANKNPVTPSDFLNLSDDVFQDILKSLRYKKMIKAINGYKSIPMEKLNYYDPVLGAKDEDTLHFIKSCYSTEFYLSENFRENWVLADNYLVRKEVSGSSSCSPKSLLLQWNEKLSTDSAELDSYLGKSNAAQ